MEILVATGGSPHSDKAIHFGAQMMNKDDDRATILTVTRLPWQRQQAEKTVAQANAILLPKVGEVRTAIRMGRPMVEILQAAEENQSDLIVLGESPSHGVMTRLTGSVSMQITGRAPCSVLIAKGQISPIQRVLLCDSGATEPSVLERFIHNGLADRLGADTAVTLLHVMSQMSVGPGLNSGKHLRANTEQLITDRSPEGKLLSRNIQLLSEHVANLSPRIRHGLVVDEIAAEAEEGSYDLVVIGAHRTTGWTRFLLDDLAYAIVAQIQRPVLLVR